VQMLIGATGQAILAQAFPTWSTTSFNETYFLTSLLHDIGTTDKNINATLMSLSVPTYLSYEESALNDHPANSTVDSLSSIS
jgi:hypothetical protein